MKIAQHSKQRWVPDVSPFRSVRVLTRFCSPFLSNIKYLKLYLDEYAFRFNQRHNGNLQFQSILERASRA